MIKLYRAQTEPESTEVLAVLLAAGARRPARRVGPAAGALGAARQERRLPERNSLPCIVREYQHYKKKREKIH